MKTELKNGKVINLGIGFVTGRANVCEVINSYYRDVLEQVERTENKILITFFIFYDTKYQGTERKEFYKINQEVFDNVRIKYITPEEREKQKEELKQKFRLTQRQVELFLGNGHAKGRNTIMYNALKEKMDYLLFWDDDEYPVACIKEENKIVWKKQENVMEHIKYMEKENADVTIGYHCGYISPIPYMSYNNEQEEKKIEDFIGAISNELVSYKSIKEKFIANQGVTYAEEKIANGKNAHEITGGKSKKFVAGSTLCLNLNHINKIPAFYNPPAARGEDTFFSMNLDNSKVIKVPVYHFHDGFLKCTPIMKGKYPEKLEMIKSTDATIEKRFYKACEGWIKYKPLLMYINDKENYKENIKNVHNKLERSCLEIAHIFENSDFKKLQKHLEEYDNKVEKHYKDFEEINKVWAIIKGG